MLSSSDVETLRGQF